MIYLFFNNKTQTFKPEITYGDGYNLTFKKGWFMFDENKQNSIPGKLSFYKLDGKTIIIDGEPYTIHKEYTFKNPIRAEIVFLGLKLNEMKNSSFDFFLPQTFTTTQKRYDELIENHPEYVI